MGLTSVSSDRARLTPIWYREQVTSLSEKLKVKPLHPHVTLFSVAGNQEYAAQLADRCAAAAKPLSCPVGAVDVSDTEHMCVFAHVTKTDELKKLRSLVSDRDYVPHVSLVYGKLDAISMDQRKALAASIALPKDTVLDMNTIEVCSALLSVQLDFFPARGSGVGHDERRLLAVDPRVLGQPGRRGQVR